MEVTDKTNGLMYSMLGRPEHRHSLTTCRTRGSRAMPVAFFSEPTRSLSLILLITSICFGSFAFNPQRIASGACRALPGSGVCNDDAFRRNCGLHVCLLNLTLIVLFWYLLPDFLGITLTTHSLATVKSLSVCHQAFPVVSPWKQDALIPALIYIYIFLNSLFFS